jgi:hypothetical protein
MSSADYPLNEMGWGECVKAIGGKKLKTILCRVSLSQVAG